MSSSHDIKVGGSINTVGSSEHPVLGDESATTEPGIANEEGHLPGLLVGLGLMSSDNLALGLLLDRGSLSTTDKLEVILASHLGSHLVPQLLGLAIDPDHVLLEVLSKVARGHGMPWHVLGGVTGRGSPSVLLRAEGTALGHSLDRKKKKYNFQKHI